MLPKQKGAYYPHSPSSPVRAFLRTGFLSHCLPSSQLNSHECSAGDLNPGRGLERPACLAELHQRSSLFNHPKFIILLFRFSKRNKRIAYLIRVATHHYLAFVNHYRFVCKLPNYIELMTYHQYGGVEFTIQLFN